MTKDNRNKSINWFKSVRSNQNQFSQTNPYEEVSTIAIEENELINVDERYTTDKYILSKENQDKVSLDLIVSLENILHDRQLILYKNDGLEDQLYIASETNNRIKQELVKKEQIIQDNHKEIHVLEANLTNKQMVYEQLLEDFKDYQNTSNSDFDKVSNQLDKQINKYNLLKDESNNIQYQNMLNIRELEEKMREIEIENKKYVEQNAKILEEKSELMQTINDFTERMSFSFSSKTMTNKV
ncbi:hypothetical protein PB01_06090 [Psychrobacillus glaciei]|uniref:Uncharacterized protein n=1 Tax=Psychrobacillus glaciei TaxID=2283160 RepID=A0A5J6SKH2_9BACI|nr:hypothetical protein [Psychrobacillus glaciei]QFF98430.1 hypothetical protein PB01_06090 [Psychrobacillus glaciei]